MSKKRSLLEVYPSDNINRAEWVDGQNTLEITLYSSAKILSAKITIIKGKNPEIHFFDIDDNGKAKLSKKFTSIGKEWLIDSSVSGVNSPVPPIKTGNKRGPKPKITDSIKEVVVAPQVTEKKSVEPLVNETKQSAQWTIKENFLKIAPLQETDLSMTLQTFVNKYIPKVSQNKVLLILTDVVEKHDKSKQKLTVQSIVSIINGLNDGPKELLKTAKNQNGLIPIAYYAALIHFFSNLIITK